VPEFLDYIYKFSTIRVANRNINDCNKTLPYMRLLEYQGKELFRQSGIKVPRSTLASSIEEAIKSGSEIGYPLIMKPQLRVGGRGKEGAILKCMTEADVANKFDDLLHTKIKGELPRGILLEQAIDIKEELYVSYFLNRSKRCYSIIASPEGGVEIESTKNKIVVDVPLKGISRETAYRIANELSYREVVKEPIANIILNLSKLVVEKEAELAEINPLVISTDESVIALDSKIIIDDNSLFRHPELIKYEYLSEQEFQARKNGFSFVELNGNIAIVGNGAGLVMSTLDMVSDEGGNAGAFLDFGGSATRDSIFQALKLIAGLSQIEVILINLFGGIVKTSLVAQAIFDGYKEGVISVPLFARISGSESDKAKEILREGRARMFDSVEDSIAAAIEAISPKEKKVHG
jgi:succinyl-CoA synthetase beta subunit